MITIILIDIVIILIVVITIMILHTNCKKIIDSVHSSLLGIREQSFNSDNFDRRSSNIVDIIANLWKTFEMFGFNVRSNGLDGYHKWCDAKNMLQIIDEKYTFTSWNSTSLSYYNTMKNNLGLFGGTFIDNNGKEVNDNSNNVIWIPHHFMLQHGRIVKFNKPSIIRLMQIAYNAGQLRAERLMHGDKIFTSDQIMFYDDISNGLTNMNSYICEKDMKMLKSQMIHNSLTNTLSSILSDVMSDVPQNVLKCASCP